MLRRMGYGFAEVGECMTWAISLQSVAVCEAGAMAPHWNGKVQNVASKRARSACAAGLGGSGEALRGTWGARNGGEYRRQKQKSPHAVGFFVAQMHRLVARAGFEPTTFGL